MDRRGFLQTAVTGSIIAGVTSAAAAAERYFPLKVDQSLFQGINRVKDPTKKSPLEKKHAPAITAPAAVKAGEPFTVEVAVGENLHDMGPAHWIEFIELRIGNEPAGRAEFQPKGYLRPKASFSVIIPKEAASDGRVTLVATENCNLHGYWESSLDIAVS